MTWGRAKISGYRAEKLSSIAEAVGYSSHLYHRCERKAGHTGLYPQNSWVWGPVWSWKNSIFLTFMAFSLHKSNILVNK